jgi:subtilisin family serine protease
MICTKCLARVAPVAVLIGVLAALPVHSQSDLGQAVARGQAPRSPGLTPQRIQAFEQAASRRLNYLPGEVVVKFKAGMSAARRTRALTALRSRPTVDDLEWTGDVGRFVDPDEADPVVMADTLARQPEVEFAQPNYIRPMPRAVDFDVRPVNVSAHTLAVPDDPDYGALQWNFSLIDAPGAWDISPGGSASVIVAVVDTGLTMGATTMTRALWTGQRFDNVALRFDRSPDLSIDRVVLPHDFAFEPGGPTFDFDGHGTHVASTIAEDANNQISLSGLAYNVHVMPVKVCVGYWELMIQRAALGLTGFLPSDSGGCADSDIASGIRYAADNGARVINISLGGVGTTPLVRDALLYAVGRGAFIAAAVGNGFETGNQVEYPAGYAPGIDGFMSVGAVGKSRARAYYSSTGNHLEIVAPGGSSRDTNGGADRGFVWQVTLTPNDLDPTRTSTPRFDRYSEVGYSGTSMSTPHVSALAALLMSRGLTNPKAVEAAIKASAQDLGASGKDPEYGYGLIQARLSLFGRGLIR